MSQTRRLFLLDAYALIFRAYYALIKMPRVTRSGFNTSAIFGFVNTLEELLKKERPTHIAVCFDPQGPTFRNEAFEQYKGERAATPEDIKLSIPFIKEIIKAYNIPVVEVEGYEADDVIGTLAKKAEKEGFTTYMMTPDKDFGQLVTPNILQYKPAYRGQDFEIRGEEEVCERFGIDNTLQVIDLLALMGDKVDNIPGCPGVGDKTASKLIKEFGSVENLLDHTDQLKGAIKKKIEENAEQIRFSKYLATICTDAPVDADPESFTLKPIDQDKLFAIFKELEFRSLTERVKKRLEKDDSERKNPEKTPAMNVSGCFPTSLFDIPEETQETTRLDKTRMDYIIVRDEETLEKARMMLDGKEICGVFMITEGENDVTVTWPGTAIAIEGKYAYFPSDYSEGKAFILDIMAKGDIMKVSPDAKRDMVALALSRNDDAESLLNYFDVGLAHYLLQPEMRHNLDSLASTYLNYEMLPHPGIATSKKGAKNLTVAGAPVEEVALWAFEQADVALRLREPLLKEVAAENMTHLLNEVELPLVRVLAGMEITGVRIDVGALNMASMEMQERIDALEDEIYELAGERFNVGSPAKVGEILFDKLQLDPKAKKTKTGQYSTSEDVLEKVAGKNPIVGKILKYRQLKKLMSTYLTALPAAINPATGKVHTNYNQTVTATGRLSSSNPNLQNIPVRDDEGREIRRAFIADPGHLFLSADYSQIELRLVADFADDEIMLDAFRHGKDIHAITAAKIYGKDSPEEVTAEERRHAKTANFGILYGISAFGLSSRLGIPRSQAKDLIDNYFATFPTIHKYMSDSVEKARETGYVSTPMGRKRRLPDINSRNPVVRGYAERNAINAPIQGAAADIIKTAMVRIDNEMRSRQLKSKMIMQVHDELNFDVPEDELPVMQELVSRCMEGAYSGRVVLTASCGVADNWLDAH